MTLEDTSLTSKEELNAELKALLQRAYESGVDVEADSNVGMESNILTGT